MSYACKILADSISVPYSVRLGIYPDPRSVRPNFTPYKRQEPPCP